jgi:hypothetical protein
MSEMWKYTPTPDPNKERRFIPRLKAGGFPARLSVNGKSICKLYIDSQTFYKLFTASGLFFDTNRLPFVQERADVL